MSFGVNHLQGSVTINYNGSEEYMEGQEMPDTVNDIQVPFDTKRMQNDTRRIIIVGKTGNGKSSTGNLILHTNKPFKAKRSSSSVTHECIERNEYRGDMGRFYSVVDTPGLFDTDVPFVSLATEIHRSLEICPEPHAFLLVFSTRNKLSPEEKNTINALEIIFGDTFFQHAIIVFTAGNDLDDIEYEEFLKDNITLTQLIEKCGNRVVRVDSNGENNIGDLFKKIEDVSRSGTIIYKDKGQCTRSFVFQQFLKTHTDQFDISILEQMAEITAMFKNRHAQEMQALKAKNERIEKENMKRNERIEREKREANRRIKRENKDSNERIEREKMESNERIERQNKESNDRIEREILYLVKGTGVALFGAAGVVGGVLAGPAILAAAPIALAPEAITVLTGAMATGSGIIGAGSGLIVSKNI